MHSLYFKNVGCVFAALLVITGHSIAGSSRKTDPVSGQTWAVRMAESVMNRRPGVYDDWDYVTGTVLKGFEETWRLTGDPRYFDYIRSTVDSLVHENGTIEGYRVDEYNIDEIQMGRMLLMLYKETRDEKYKKAADLLRIQLGGHPRTQGGGFWHKKIYPWQMWLDGLYMGMPFYAEYAILFDEPEILEDVLRQFSLIEANLKDTRTGLYYHAWDESKQMFWADPETGLTQCFWGRGLGWFAMAVVDVLDYFPETHPGREKLIKIMQGLAGVIAAYQDKKTGLWWQVLDQGPREGNYIEGSVSPMFVYAIAKAVRFGYIDRKFHKTACKGFHGLTRHLIYLDSRGNDNLLRICRSAGLGGKYIEKIRDGSYEYYVYMEPIVANDGKGIGPYMAACVEMHRIGALK